VRRDYEDESRNVDGLKHFLTSQNSLQNLSMENFDRNSSIFNENLELRFRLKHLKVKYFDDYNNFFFKEFLEAQKESLTHLEVAQVHHDLLSLFRKFANLKNVKVTNVCSSFDPMAFVEVLEIKEVDGSWSDKFLNLKNLTIIGGNEDVQQVEKLKNLEVLKIKNCEIPELKIPTVKRLALIRVSLLDGAARPFDFETNIVELLVDKCSDVKWLFEFLKCKNVNVKLLTIRKSKVDDEGLELLESSRIKKLQIINCRGITEEDIENDYSDYSDDDDDDDVHDDDDNDENEVGDHDEVDDDNRDHENEVNEEHLNDNEPNVENDQRHQNERP
jgi:hypothetical protein